MPEQAPHLNEIGEPDNQSISGELMVPHEYDQINDDKRRLEKWQFRKSWAKLFGGIANKEEVGDLSWYTKAKAAESDDMHLPNEAELVSEPIEKLYELRQEVKDKPPVNLPETKSATPVGKVMAEAISKRQANLPSDLSTSESLHRTIQQQRTASTQISSLYKQAVIYGLVGATVLLGLMTLFAILKR
ncbi:MAG TPA: hypothetical protein VLF39_00155 [Candidatus Saccharimonadales bacterium]|nr:hypothetical protein [Candidatus Saccharimonadales bacterium]